MVKAANGRMAEVLHKYEADVLKEWMEKQKSAVSRRADLLKESELREQSREFLSVLTRAVQGGDVNDIMASDWTEVREALTGVSRSRAHQGFSPSETASFVFSLKEPLFNRLPAGRKTGPLSG